MNLANQNSQGTRARVVGQMSDLIQEFKGNLLSDWELWYLEKHPEALDNATEKVYSMILALKDAMQNINEEVVRQWLQELIIVKTFSGLKFQEAILKKVATHFGKAYRLATPEEESKMIDGFIGDQPVSIKPDSYKSKMTLNEVINIPVIFYTKKKNEILIEFDL